MSPIVKIISTNRITFSTFRDVIMINMLELLLNTLYISRNFTELFRNIWNFGGVSYDQQFLDRELYFAVYRKENYYLTA